MLEVIASLSPRIRYYDKQIEQMAAERYPENEILRQIRGVGMLTTLAFVLILEDPKRFGKSRAVGAYLGLPPDKDQSSERNPQNRISKEGNEMLRFLLVGSAHYALGPFGEDSGLRRHGLKTAKKRAVVAVSRKLSVLLHHLWISGEAYEPLYNSQRPEEYRVAGEKQRGRAPEGRGQVS